MMCSPKRLFYFHIFVAIWASLTIAFTVYKGMPLWTVLLNLAVVAWNIYNIRKITSKS